MATSNVVSISEGRKKPPSTVQAGANKAKPLKLSERLRSSISDDLKNQLREQKRGEHGFSK